MQSWQISVRNCHSSHSTPKTSVFPAQLLSQEWEQLFPFFTLGAVMEEPRRVLCSCADKLFNGRKELTTWTFLLTWAEIPAWVNLCVRPCKLNSLSRMQSQDFLALVTAPGRIPDPLQIFVLVSAAAEYPCVLQIHGSGGSWGWSCQQLGKCEITQSVLQIVEDVLIPAAIKAECRHEQNS